MKESPDSLENFRLTSNHLEDQSHPLLPKRRRGWFVKGPLDGEWIGKAAALPGKSLHVALAIQYKAGLTKSSHVKVTNQDRERFSLKPDAYRRGLKALEAAGLVKVVRKPGACAQISIV
jgi:hypothetical protein